MKKKNDVVWLTIKSVDHTIAVPVTTFLKVAYGKRENPGGYGTFSET